MDYQELLEQVTPQVYASFKRALETGKWPDGAIMTVDQKEHCMQAIIAYDELRVPQQQRVGFIDAGKKEKSETITWKGENNE
jgi:uncharacterized protein